MSINVQKKIQCLPYEPQFRWPDESFFFFSDIFHICWFRNRFFYFISDLDCDDQNEEGSPGGKTISEVKLSMTGAESQAIAQTIVFSFI